MTIEQINQDAVRLMKQAYDIDMEKSQSPKLLEDIPSVDIVVTMGCNVYCPDLPASHREDWGLDDPTGLPDDVFLETIETIAEKILDLKSRIERDELTSGGLIIDRQLPDFNR